MSESQAARRLAACRCLVLMSELGAKIESGVLSLSNLSLAQAAFCREPRSVAEKRSVLLELENKTTREAEKILLARSALPPIAVVEKFGVVSEEMSELRLPVDSLPLADLKRLRNLWGFSSFTEGIRKIASVC